MKIAVLAWGSLIWSPRNLIVKPGHWNDDGPKLPVEFSRIASDGRLTLVIDPDYSEIGVYWKLMATNNLAEARENLRDREGAELLNEIGFVNEVDQTFIIREESRHLIDHIKSWCQSKKLDAVIWTDLPPKFYEKTNRSFRIDSAMDYLNSLEGETFKRAREYILNAPPQTQTSLRKQLEESLKKR